MKQNQQAFTIIEVIFFLAISGFLLFIALNGILGKNEEVRFSQSVRSLESFLQQQYDYVRNGVVTNSGSITCSSGGDCVVLGRAIEFTPGSNEIKVHVITGDRLIDPSAVDKIAAKTFSEAEPSVIADVQTANIEWQAKFLGGKMKIDGLDGFSENSRVIAFVRLPNGTEIQPIGFRVAAGQALDSLDYDCLYDGDNLCSLSGSRSTTNDNFVAELCIESFGGGKFAKIVFGGSERKQAIKAEFLEGQSCAV